MKKNQYLLTILVALALLVCVGMGWGLEWADRIQITNHTSGMMSNLYFDAKADAAGNFHLFYFLDDVQDSVGVYYTKCDGEGRILINPMLIFPGLNEDRFWESGRAMCVDPDNNAHILTKDDHEYYYAIIDENGEYIHEPAIIEGLAHPWYGGVLSPVSSAMSHLEMTSDGNLVMECSDLVSREDEIKAITYTRFTPEGELIDSTRIVHWAENESVWGPTRFYLDQNDNMYFTWRLLRTIPNGGNTGRFAMVTAADSVVVANYQAPQHREFVGASSLGGVTTDSHGNIYLLLSESAENGLVIIRKMNCDMEVLADVEMGYSGFSHFLEVIFCANDTIYAIHFSPHEGYDENCFLMAVDTTGNQIDSLEAVPYASGARIHAMMVDNEIYIIYLSRGDDDDQYDVYMSHTISESAIISPNEPLSYSLVEVFPNPFNNAFNIILPPENRGSVLVSIFDMNGRKVFQTNHSSNVGIVSIDATNFPTGEYIVHLKSEKFSQTIPVSCLK